MGARRDRAPSRRFWLPMNGRPLPKMGLSLLLSSKLDQRIHVSSRFMIRGLGPLYNFFLVTPLPHRIALEKSWYPHSISDPLRTYGKDNARNPAILLNPTESWNPGILSLKAKGSARNPGILSLKTKRKARDPGILSLKAKEKVRKSGILQNSSESYRILESLV